MAASKINHGQWSSRLMFVLAAAGSAVGLGNVWKFPYIAGENGGGAFVLMYLVCIALVGLPLMIAEILLGRRGRQNPVNTMARLAAAAGAHSAWRFLGWMGVVAGFLILSYYSVIAGWALAYVLRSASGVFNYATADGVKHIFDQFVGDPERLLAWHTLFMVMTMMVVARGVSHGLERAVRYLMPALLLLLLVLIGYASTTGYFVAGLEFLFTPDFSKLFLHCETVDGTQTCTATAQPLLTALGHAFFTLSLGMGAIMIYGAYMPRQSSIAGSALLVVLADTAVALLAGMAIFPIVFANGLEPGAGPGLIFQTLPIAFGSLPGGQFFASLFFVLLVFAAWTSSISLIEPAVSWMVERMQIGRVRASIVCGLVTWLLGMGTVFSFNLWSDVKLWDMTFFDLLDYLTANLMLPLGGLLIAVFAGWIMTRESTDHELALPQPLFRLWWWVLRYVSPLLVLIIMLQATGLLSLGLGSIWRGLRMLLGLF